MNKKDFIAELAKKTGLSTDDSAKVNDVLENNNLLAGLGNAGKIISDIAAKLGICRSAEDLWQNIVKAPQEY